MEVKFGNYGQEREINATPEEYEIAEWIVNYFPNEPLRLVRVSNDYVTIKRNDWDIVRLKYTKRAKWLMFPVIEIKQKKHYLDDKFEAENYVAAMHDSIEHAKRYDS